MVPSRGLHHGPGLEGGLRPCWRKRLTSQAGVIEVGEHSGAPAMAMTMRVGPVRQAGGGGHGRRHQGGGGGQATGGGALGNPQRGGDTRRPRGSPACRYRERTCRPARCRCRSPAIRRHEHAAGTGDQDDGADRGSRRRCRTSRAAPCLALAQEHPEGVQHSDEQGDRGLADHAQHVDPVPHLFADDALTSRALRPVSMKMSTSGSRDEITWPSSAPCRKSCSALALAKLGAGAAQTLAGPEPEQVAPDTAGGQRDQQGPNDGEQTDVGAAARWRATGPRWGGGRRASPQGTGGGQGMPGTEPPNRFATLKMMGSDDETGVEEDREANSREATPSAKGRGRSQKLVGQGRPVPGAPVISRIRPIMAPRPTSSATEAKCRRNRSAWWGSPGHR